MTLEKKQTRQRDQKLVPSSHDGFKSYGSAEGKTEPEPDMRQSLLDLQKENAGLRKMHHDLERSLLKFTNLFDFAPTAYFTLDSKFSITEANHAACKLLSANREELIDMAFSRLIAPEDQEEFQHLRNIGNHTGQNTCDLHITKPNGEKMFLHLESSVTTTSKGKAAYRLTAIDISESNVLMETIAHSRDFQLAVMDDMPSLVWRSGPTGEFDYFNKTWLAFTNRPIEQEEGKGWLDGMHTDDLPMFLATLHTAYVDKTEFDAEFRLRRHDGEFRWLSAKGHPFYNFTKEFAGFICACYDINERHLDEITIKQQNAFLNNVLESLTHPFCIIDAKDYGIIKANSAAYNIYGKRDNTRCYEIMHGINQPCDASNMMCPLNMVRETNQSARVEHTHLNKKGDTRIMDVYCYPIFGEDGKLSQVIEYSFDITDRKKTEQLLRVELKIREALAEIAFDTLSSPMSIDETIKAVHRHALSLTGCEQLFVGALNTDRSVTYVLDNTPEAVQKSPLIEELPYGISQVWLAACKNPRVEGEMVIRNPISRKPGRILSIPAIGKEQVLGLIILYTENRKFGPEITEIIYRLAKLYAMALQQMHNAEELRSAKASAEESDMLKSMFLSNMSHDIRTPMNAIIGFSEMLQDPDITREESMRFLDIIITSGDALIRLINDIIDISKLEARQLNIIKSNFSLNELFSDLYLSFTEELVRNHHDETRLVLNKQYPEQDYTLYSDHIRLRQIFSNLLGNALKFTDRGIIEFGYTFTDPMVFCFFVKDTGIGIPRDKLNLIFERFGQIEETRERNQGGTGLGLAISKSLVELLGGVLWVESEPGQGTCFYFTLPAKSSAISSILNQGIPKALDVDFVDWSDKVILIAEDVESNFFLLQTILKKTGVLLKWAKNGKEAIEMCRDNADIDLVLMDIQMPVINGYDSTREIKKIRPSLPVIAQTAYAMSGEKEKSIDAGCDDYITKPLKKKDLFQHINRFFAL